MIMPYQSVGDFPFDVMMNQFDLSDWNYNDDSDLYESIGLIKDYYDIYNDRQTKASNIGHIPPCKNSTPSRNN
jgi:hypothetical protein